jgi:hypothetical protein
MSAIVGSCRLMAVWEEVGLGSDPLYHLSHCNRLFLTKFESHLVRTDLAAKTHPRVLKAIRPRDHVGKRHQDFYFDQVTGR